VFRCRSRDRARRTGRPPRRSAIPRRRARCGEHSAGVPVHPLRCVGPLGRARTCRSRTVVPASCARHPLRPGPLRPAAPGPSRPDGPVWARCTRLAAPSPLPSRPLAPARCALNHWTHRSPNPAAPRTAGPTVPPTPLPLEPPDPTVPRPAASGPSRPGGPPARAWHRGLKGNPPEATARSWPAPGPAGPARRRIGKGLARSPARRPR